MSYPTVTIRAGFGSNAMAGTPSWTDISDDKLSISTKRGRQFELDRFEPGEIIAELDNSHLKYWPDNGNSAFYPNVKPGCQFNVRAAYGGTTYDVILALVEDWEPHFRDSGGTRVPVTVMRGAEVSKLLAGIDLGGTSYSEENSGTRVANILNTAGWPSNRRSINTGQTTIQAASTFDNKSPAVDHLSDVQDAELGVLWQATSGTINYQDRHARLKSPYTTSQGTIGVGVNEWHYAQPQFNYGDRLIRNDITIVRNGGGTGSASDATSQNSYGIRSLTRTGVLMTTDAEAQDQADYLNSRYKEPDFRVRGITIKPGENPDVLFPQVLQREIGDRVTVSLPSGSVSADYHIEGIEHEIIGKDWLTRWWLSPANAQVYWALGIAGLSELDETTRLAY